MLFMFHLLDRRLGCYATCIKIFQKCPSWFESIESIFFVGLGLNLIKKTKQNNLTVKNSFEKY